MIVTRVYLSCEGDLLMTLLTLSPSSLLVMLQTGVGILAIVVTAVANSARAGVVAVTCAGAVNINAVCQRTA